jgi:hypothetical protein
MRIPNVDSSNNFTLCKVTLRNSPIAHLLCLKAANLQPGP